LLEALNIIPDHADDDDMLVHGATVNEEDHIPTNEESMGGVDEPVEARTREVSGRMQNRGMPYFEEMVENSRLGRIKRQKGGHTSRDGRMMVQWEVVEIGGDDEPTAMESVQETDTGGGSNKRQKTDA
jgi:hypothetical protein